MPAIGDGSGGFGVTRRHFLWTMAAAAAAAGCQEGGDIFWAADGSADPGWAPGLEQHLASACLICPSRCGIRGRVVDGRLVGISGNSLHPLNLGGLCPRGVAGVQTLYHPERLTHPMVRVGDRGRGAWLEVSREEALTLLADHLGDARASGRPESLAVLAGYCAGSMEDLWRRFLEAYGSPNYVADDYDDGAGALMGLMHGVSGRPSYDLDGAALVLSFGAPLFESWWSPLQAYVAFAGRARQDGQRPRFVQVDTRFSRTAARTHEWVGVQPNTHGVLALGIAYVLIRDGLYDADFLADHVVGFEDSVDSSGSMSEGYRSLVMRHYRTEEVSAATGVSVERITALAQAFAESAPAIALSGADLAQAPNGLAAGLAVHSLNILMGSVNRPGGVLFGEAPPLAPLAPVRLDDTAGAGLARERATGARPLFGAGDEADRLASALAGGDTGVDTLLLYYANPLASSARPEMWTAALAQTPFVVSFSPFMDETTRQADLILPDLLPYERWQDAPAPASYPYPVWGVARPLVQPPEGAMHTGDALLQVARLLGGSVAESLTYADFEALLESRARGLHATRRGMLFSGEFERRHHRQMEERGWWIPEHEEFDAFWDALVERGGWTDLFIDHTDPGGLSQRPDGRIDLMPAELSRAMIERGLDGAIYTQVGPDDSEPSGEYPLRLIPYRVSTLASGTLALERWMAEVPTLFPHVFWHPWVEVNPRTAAGLDLEDGAEVWVVSNQDRIRVRLEVSPGTAEGNVCVPYRVPGADGESSNPLRLLDGRVDPLTGLPSWSSTSVRLEAV